MDTEQEKTFYEDDEVLVTQSRFVANGKTFAMRNISSVANLEIEKSRLFAYICIVIGVISLIAQWWGFGLGS